MSNKPTKETFLKDVENHKMQVLKGDGLYRHLRFSDGSWHLKFDIITWPMHLVCTGDMGSYLFSRVDDMFTFFRRREGLAINPVYWSEKCISQSRFGEGIKKFSADTFRENVLSNIRSSLDIDENDEIPEEMLEEIEPIMDAEDEYECVEEMRRFSSDIVEFHDFWEYDNDEYTYHFLWCLYAIVWAISVYDMEKEQSNRGPWTGHIGE